MIKAIIFDFFGVLANEGTISFSRAYYPDDRAKLLKTWELQDRLNLAAISIDEYKVHLAELGGVSQDVVSSYIDTHQPNKQLLEYIRSDLKPHYKIGILSNSGDDWTKQILGSQDLTLFDAVILSYREGYIKPDPAIYKLAADRLNISAKEAVFTDDKEKYCTAAKEIGMKAIIYKDFEQFKRELEALTAEADN